MFMVVLSFGNPAERDRPDHLPTDRFTGYTTKNMIFGCVRKLGIQYTIYHQNMEKKQTCCSDNENE